MELYTMTEKLCRLNTTDIMPNTLIDQERDRTLLASSVARFGILQPPMVRPHPKHHGKYEIVYGQGRWEAARKARLKQIWVIIRECSDLELLKLGAAELMCEAILHQSKKVNNSNECGIWGAQGS